MIRALAIGAVVSVVVLVIALVTPFEPSKPAVQAAAAVAGDATHGATLYAASCAGCHGATGGGGVGPDITRVTAAAALAQIASGGGTMPAGLVKGQDAADVAAFVDTLDGSPAAGARDAGIRPRPTAAAPATTAPQRRPTRRRQALADVTTDLRKGQSQIDVLVQHTGFIEQALAQDNVFNVRFHAEHLANITLGEPIRDLDGNGQASNPGDGVGLLGEGGYVAEATAPFVTIAQDAGVAPDDAARAVACAGVGRR